MSNITRSDPLDDQFRGFFVCPMDLGTGQTTVPSIKVDVAENEQGYTVHAELPGVKKEDIHVTVEALRRLCADLRLSLSTTQQTQSRLAEALVDTL